MTKKNFVDVLSSSEIAVMPLTCRFLRPTFYTHYSLLRSFVSLFFFIYPFNPWSLRLCLLPDPSCDCALFHCGFSSPFSPSTPYKKANKVIFRKNPHPDPIENVQRSVLCVSVLSIFLSNTILSTSPLISSCWSCAWLIFSIVLTVVVIAVVGIYLGWYEPKDPSIKQSIDDHVDYVKDKLG